MSTGKQTSQNDTSSGPQDPGMVAVIKTYLDELGWTYEQSDREEGDRVLLTARIQVDPVVSRTVFDIAVSRNRFGLFAYVPFTVPEEKRMAVMEYLTRANHRLFLAKLEFDLDDGEWRTVCTVITEDSALSASMVHRMRRTAHSVIERYAPGVLGIIYGHKTAQQAWQALLDSEAEDERTAPAAEPEGTDSTSEAE